MHYGIVGSFKEITIRKLKLFSLNLSKCFWNKKPMNFRFNFFFGVFESRWGILRALFSSDRVRDSLLSPPGLVHRVGWQSCHETWSPADIDTWHWHGHSGMDTIQFDQHSQTYCQAEMTTGLGKGREPLSSSIFKLMKALVETLLTNKETQFRLFTGDGSSSMGTLWLGWVGKQFDHLMQNS